MDVHKNNTMEVDAPASSESRDQWVEKHAHQIQQLFHQWQQPMGIDDQAYREHLEKELAAYWHDPLLKTLIENI